MAKYRPERVGEMVHREVARRLRTDVKNLDLMEVSITRVQMNRDLSVAKVFWLPLGGGDPSEETSEALSHAARAIRGPIGRALRLRVAPVILFQHDKHHEDAVRLTGLLEQISADLPGSDEEGA